MILKLHLCGIGIYFWMISRIAKANIYVEVVVTIQCTIRAVKN